MKFERLLIFLFVFSALPLFSQIAIQARTSHGAFMLYDGVYIRLALRNYSAHPIAFGNQSKLRGTLEFFVYNDSMVPVQKREANAISSIENVMLAPGESKVFTFNLNRLFAFNEPGHYRMRAIVKHPQLNDAYQSNEVRIEIRKGYVVWERSFGVPDFVGKNTGKIPTRVAKLHRFFDNTNLYFYLSIEDEKNVYLMQRLAFDMGGNLKPQIEIDAIGRIHALVAANQRVFAYYVYNYTGKLENRSIYIRTSSTPFLVRNPMNSSMIIDGGRPARKDIDYEEISELPFLDEVKKEDSFQEKSALDKDSSPTVHRSEID